MNSRTREFKTWHEGNAAVTTVVTIVRGHVGMVLEHGVYSIVILNSGRSVVVNAPYAEVKEWVDE